MGYSKSSQYRKQWRNPPSAIRFLGYIKHCWRMNSSGSRWVRISLKDFSFLSGLSYRQVVRAKNHLQATGRVVFQTLSNRRGVRGHTVYAADPWDLTGTKGNLLAWERNGRVRNRWTRIGGTLVPLPTSASGVPRDITIESKAYSIRQSYSRTNDCGKITPLERVPEAVPRPPPLLQWNPKRKPTAAERKLAFRITRQLSERAWWDNCKVNHPGKHLGGIYNLVLRWISRGVYSEKIISEFNESLRQMHGLCVDLQLLHGTPELRFHVGSTITRTDRSLAMKWGTSELQHWSQFVVTCE
jgi:hypothetical protein